MTKEHKLALIVGFALVLIVGVLISDHFSRARTARVEGSLSERTPDDFGSDTDGLDQPIVAPPPVPPADPIARGDGPSAPLPFEDGREAIPSPLPVQPAPVLTMGGPEIPPGLQPHVEAIPGREPIRESGTVPGFDNVPEPNRLPTGPAPMSPEPKPVVAPPAVLPPPPLVQTVSVEPRRHTVRDGETLYGIVKKTYGDGALWSKLREHNPGKISPDGTVRAGVMLSLPPKEVLVGSSVASPAASKRPEPGKSKPAPARPGSDKPAPKQTYATYTMRPGDTLGEVSKKLLKSSKRAGEIASLNNIRDPDDIPAGTTLRVPVN